MDGSQVFPSFLRLEYEPDGSTKSRFLSDVNGLLDTAENRFEQFGREASRQLDAALSVKRNSFGSLDLGVDELKASAVAQQARAVAAREVAAATRAAAEAEGDYSQKARLAIAATEALANEEEQAARAAMSHANAAEQVQNQLNRQKSAVEGVVASTGRNVAAQHKAGLSANSSRMAYVQLGQQMQDVTVQAQMGTNAFIIFSQQVPQAAFALSGLANSANATQARIGKFATVLSGPWGAAIFGATALLGPFIAGMLSSGDAADEAGAAFETQASKLDMQKHSLTEVIKALKEYNAEQERSREITLDAAAATAKKVAEDIKEAIAIRQSIKAMLDQESSRAFIALQAAGGNLVSAPAVYKYQQFQLESQLAKQDELINELTGGAKNAVAEVADELAKINSDPRYAIEQRFLSLRNEAKASIQNVTVLTERLIELRKEERAALDALSRSTKSISDSAKASVGDMVALLKQVMPGVQITSTTGGKHTAGSDHYKGRAIDFVPAGGMGAYTKDEMRQLLLDAGVDIRRNASGVEQFFGPGDKGHGNHFHLAWEGKSPDPEKVAAAAARAQQALREMGASAAESIARISERFDEQPRLIDQVEQATRSLDKTIADLSKRKPPGFEDMIADAQRAKAVVQEAVNKPFKDYIQDQERSANIQRLILAGRQDEADALRTIYTLQDRVGSVTEDQREAILANVEAERQLNDLLEKRQEIIGAYTSSIAGVRSDIEGLLGGSLSGKDFFKNLKTNFQQLQGKLLTEQLFGDLFRQLEEKIRRETGIKTSVDIMKEGMEDAAAAAGTLDNSLLRLDQRVNATLNGAKSLTGAAASPAGVGSAIVTAAAIGAAVNDNGSSGVNADGEIVVTARKTADEASRAAAAAKRAADGLAGIRPEEYATMMAKIITAPITEQLKELGIDLSGTLSGVLAGDMVGGLPGAIVGGLKGFVFDYGPDIFGKGLTEKLLPELDSALSGAATGTQTANLMKALGIKTSTTGAQIGGTIGSFLPIPGGEIIGSVVGGILGGLFKKTKKGKATIGGIGDDAVISLTGNSGKRTDAANSAAGAVTDAIANLASALGAEVDYALGAVTIALRDDNWRVDPTGLGNTKTSKGAIDFGDDQEAAIAYAVKNLIEDGVLTGIRQSTLNILKAGNDLEQAIQDALDFEGVFKELKSYKDPVGAALDDLNAEFERLIGLFQDAGASAEEWAQLEELYGIKRAEAIEAATQAAISSLQNLYDFLTYGDNGLSLRDRDTALRSEYADLKARVQSGDTTAYDRFAEVAQELLDVERQLYGSQQPYFDMLAEVTAVTKQAMDAQTAIANAAANADNPFSDTTIPANDNSTVVTAIDNLSLAVAESIGYKLDATNQNLGTMILQNQQLQAILGSQSVATGSY